MWIYIVLSKLPEFWDLPFLFAATEEALEIELKKFYPDIVFSGDSTDNPYSYKRYYTNNTDTADLIIAIKTRLVNINFSDDRNELL